MQTTKSQILVHLNRSAGASVDELAGSVGVARMTVRQHLANLERDGLVSSSAVRRPTGRPHYVYRLTEKGQETFTRQYSRLAERILEEVALLDGREIMNLTPSAKKQLLFQKMTKRLLPQYEMRLRGKNLRQRVAAVTKILDEEGGLAEWRQVNGGYEIDVYNCVFLRVAKADGHVCGWHEGLVTELLGIAAACRRSIADGSGNCRFEIEGDEHAPADTGRKD